MSAKSRMHKPHRQGQSECPYDSEKSAVNGRDRNR
jgi:hypothetical protein